MAASSISVLKKAARGVNRRNVENVSFGRSPVAGSHVPTMLGPRANQHVANIAKAWNRSKVESSLGKKRK